MYTLLIILHVFVSFALTIVILLQSSKGGGLAGTFGGAGIGAVFGGRGTATFLSKLTAGLATAFLLVSLLLGLMTKGGVSARSLVQQERERQASTPASVLPTIPAEQYAPGASAPTPAVPAEANQGSGVTATPDSSK